MFVNNAVKENIMDTRYIYVRKMKCNCCGNVNKNSRIPIGCIAYTELEDNLMAYGYSALHPDDVGFFVKKEARSRAASRLTLAVNNTKRTIAERGIVGIVEVKDAKCLNDKVIAIIQNIENNNSTKKWFKDNLPHLREKLSKKERAIAA